MGIVGDLNQYTQFQTANAIGDAANNPGGAGEGLGVGLGMALGQRVGQQYQQPYPQQQPGYATPPQGYQQQGYQQAPPPDGPPPLPQQTQWYVGANGQQLGPFDQNGLQQQVGAGVLTPQSLVWHQGMAAWTPAAQVPELTSLFGATPPPLPPQG